MKNNRLNILSLLICLIISHVYTYAQQVAPIKNVFVLIDVSATMRDDAINQEAKQHIKNILIGRFSLSDANRQGWTMQYKCDVFENNKPIVQKNSFLAIIPFGNKERYDERAFNRFSDVNIEFDDFFEKNYRLNHTDLLTYLSLAQGYAGSLAKAQKIEKSYMIIYSDGLNDQTGSIPYSDYENSIVDSWNVVGKNKYNTLGMLYRKSGKYTYKIYVGQLEIYDVEVRGIDTGDDDTTTNATTETSKIIITNPKNSSERESAKVNAKEDVTVSWIGVMNANVSITKYDGKKYIRLSSKGSEEAKLLSKGGNSAQIRFYDSGKYKVTVSKGSVSDSAYFEVSTSFPFGLILLLILLIALVIAGLKYLPDIMKSKPKSNPSPSSGRKDDNW